MSIYNNQPYDDIRNYVLSDLSKYGQDNPCPISLTIKTDNGFRHYELGSIVGFILIGTYDENNQLRTMISIVEEDDEYWFAPNTSIYMCGSWMIEMQNTFNRMVNWYKEHIFEGFVQGCQPTNWQTVIKKPIENEEIFYKNNPNISACPVIGIDEDNVYNKPDWNK